MNKDRAWLKREILDYLSINPVKKILLVLFLLFIGFLAFKGLPVTSWGPSANYENVSVRTTVNVTNSFPEILNITCNSGNPVTLNAGTTQAVSCLVEIRDYNGGGDVNYVNGTFFYYLNSSADPDDNNTHYSNSSCTNTSSSGYFTNWTCVFDVYYHANNGTWQMNATVNDTYGAKDTDVRNSSINALLALNVTNVIDFGNMAVTDTYIATPPPSANVTNFGNVPINVSVWGFGSNDSVAGAGMAMICAVRNITIHNERWDLSSATGYAAMTRLAVAPDTIEGLTVDKQTVSGSGGYVINATYWRLHVNLTTNPFGICNGTVVFAAESP